MTPKISVAPMMNWTDRHCRKFHGLINKTAPLYTEMITTGAILHGNAKNYLYDDHLQNNIILQLGGCNPEDLYRSAVIAKEFGYKKINLNCGCPSPRVKRGSFGACLMKEPQLVADCISAMRQTQLPISVKCRIGVDDLDQYSSLQYFTKTVADAGICELIVHARKAWLQGLSPKQNREVPPLQYAKVYQLQVDFPQLPIIINGGITSVDQVREHLIKVPQVMLGRSAYSNPMLLADVGVRLQMSVNLDRIAIFKLYSDYAVEQMASGTVQNLHQIMRHCYGLFNGAKGSKRFRRTLAQGAYKINRCFDAQILLKNVLQCLQ